MFAGRIIIDGMNYQVADLEVPEANPQGLPTGRILKAKALVIQDSHNPMLQVEVRMTPEQLDEMGRTLQGQVVVQANGQDLQRLKGMEQRILRP
jgi:hypothetical protein